MSVRTVTPVLLAALFFASTGSQSLAITRYVNINNIAPVSPHTNWVTAATDIQDAIDVASPGDTVLVTNGVYASGGAPLPGYALTNRVCITTNMTVQSVNGPEFTFIVGAEDTATSNGLASVRCAALVTNAVVSGFTLTNGYTMIFSEPDEDMDGYMMASEPPDPWDMIGGGALLDQGGMLSNCVVSACVAFEGGGGVYCFGSGILNRCVIEHNSASNGGGGGVQLENGGSANNCLIAANFADYEGGGVYCSDGGIFNNCTIVENIGGGVAAYGEDYGDVRFQNCIIYDNIDREGYRSNHSGNGMFEYCCTTPMPGDEWEGGEGDPPEGCITNNPRFLDLEGGNYRLRSSSPCLDSGTNGYVVGSVDLDGHARIVNSTVDMGAYESRQLLVITSPSNGGTTVYGETNHYDLSGTCHASIVGSLVWTNGANGASGALPAAAFWNITEVPLGWGANAIVVSGTNAVGDHAVDSVEIMRSYEHGGSSPDHYVWIDSPSSAWPYTNWNSAAHILQDAVDTAVGGDTVWANSGVYNTGGAVASARQGTNRVAIEKVVALRAVGDPSNTLIVGAMGTIETNGADAVRCVYLSTGAELHGFTLMDGYAQYYGGGLILEGGSTASNCVVEGCSTGSGGSGGGVYCLGGYLVDCWIADNSANYGGGAYCCLSGIVTRCTIATNYAYYGGGLYTTEGAVVTDCVIATNTGGRGAGIYNYDSHVSHSVIENNWSTDEGGGIRGGGSALFSDCTIRGNSTRQGGGGVLCYNDTTLLRCRITDNESRSAGGGGGINFYHSGYAKNCLIDGNRADSAGGGVYCRDGGVVDNCTIVGNSVATNGASYGGGAYCNGGGTFRNTIVYGNTAGTGSNYWGSSETFIHSCTTPDPGDPGNITADPRFIDAAAGNWRIGYGSPCIDAGTNETVQGSTDLDGNTRIVNSIVDMGAYEYDGEIYDSDGDSSTDGEEYIADTDPTDGNDWFHIASVSNGAILFDSSDARLYTLFACTNLVEGFWNPVPGTPPRMGVGGSDSMQSTNNLPVEFYKLTVELP